MIGSDELLANLRASVRLLLGDRAGLAAFDVSLDGFWRSFGVIALLVPTALVSILADHQLARPPLDGEAGSALAARLITGGLTYVLGWIAFPLVVAALAKPFGLGRVFVPWMVARNWTAILSALPAFVVTLAWLLGLLPLGALGSASLMSLGFSLYCSFAVARLAAGLTVAHAIGFVLLDFLLSILIETALDRLFGL